jgi:hypothetical protein
MTDKKDTSQEVDEELQQLRARGSRLFSCLLIAAVFVIIDLAILLYFFLPSDTPVDGGQDTGKNIARERVLVQPDGSNAASGRE